MKNKWKKTAAFTLALAILAVNSATSWSNTNKIFAQAAEISEAAVTADTDSADAAKEGEDESYYDAETQTIHLKGCIRNSEDGSGLVIPEGVDRWEVQAVVADEGTVFPQDSSSLFIGLPYVFSLDLKNADTSNVTNMSMMFRGLSAQEIDLSGFDTSNVTDMSEMFFSSYVPNIDLSSFDTSKVTNMASMFAYSFFSTLDLTGFDTSNVTVMTNMFGGSCNLETIYVSDKWSVENVDREQYNDQDMFYDCTYLSGGKGTAFDPNFTDSEYARIDGGEEAPGYLSAVGDKQDLSYFDKKTSTLHLKGYVKNGGVYGGMILPEGVAKEDVLHITADEGTILPLNSSSLFFDMVNLETADLKNAASSTIFDMRSMFEFCSNLVSVDLTGIDTSNVKDMGFMFAECEKLEAIDLSGFNTSSVNNMCGMFEYCSSLSSLDLSTFDTSSVWDMGMMFRGCSFEALDITSFDTSYVSYMDYMFSDCKNLKELDLSNFNTSNVFIMSGMFSDCDSLSYVDLSSFNTANVFDMSQMFEGCQSLEILDLSRFDTTNVEYMGAMFADCYNLKTIYVGSKWITLKVDRTIGGTDIFKDCYKLTGAKGTVYDPYNTGVEYAHIDGGRFVPGYFTADPAIVENTVKDVANKVKDIFDKYKPFK